MRRPIQRLLAVGGIALLSLAIGAPVMAKPVSGPGEVSVGVDASVWDSTLSGPGLVPIGGAGQVNGQFTTAERLGIQIGLRAQKRFAGPITATASSNGKVGIYEAATGISSPGRATWNYDLHVDLRGAKGVAKGTTWDDYELTLETDLAPALASANLTPFAPAATVLYQQSWNPTFFNDVFDPTVAGTYHVRLVLTPATFNGPPLAVAIVIVVE